MTQQKRIRDAGVIVGELPCGQRNKITDVPGVTVGHCTIDSENHHTGVTVVMPCRQNIFANKLLAAGYVWNGFGKTAGLVQIQELGTLETPIALTNTLNVGLMQDALVEYMVRRCREDGVTMKSINPVVGECNDSRLNDICERAVKEEHLMQAIQSAGEDFPLGAVGAGRGTICHGLKGGIGSASRVIELDGKTYTLGLLVQSNHGRMSDLTIAGRNIGREIAEQIKAREEQLQPECDKGSIMMIAATDLPVSERQLGRILRRASVGLARLGSFVGHGSGEIMIGFSTAHSVRYDEEQVQRMDIMPEGKIDLAFRAIAECGGTIGLNYSAGFISPDIHSHTSRIDDMVRHMKHLYQVGGIECMALGGDLDGIRGDLEIDSTDKTLWLLERLKKEGFTESQIDKIAYDNMFRLIGETL